MMERPGSEFPLHRPVMVFMLQRHDLDSLQLAMKQALRKAACRVYALQVCLFNDIFIHIYKKCCYKIN